MVDLTGIRNFSQKKSYSVSAATLRADDFDVLNSLELFNIPEKSVITNVYVVTDVAGDAALTLKVSIGSRTAIAAANVSVSGVSSEVRYNRQSGTGEKVQVTPSKAVTTGDFTIIVEYLEYTLGTGTLTNYSDTITG